MWFLRPQAAFPSVQLRVCKNESSSGMVQFISSKLGDNSIEGPWGFQSYRLDTGD